MNLDNHLEDALLLKSYGFNVMPIPPPSKDYDGKTPYKKIPWREFVSQPLTKPILEDHYRKHPNDSIAILTGQVSNLCVIDLDRHNVSDEEVQVAMNHILALFKPDHPPPIAFTGGGGVHFYTQQAAVKNTIGIPFNQIFPDLPPSPITIDIKSDGGYVIAPPSYHRSGKQYLWHPKYPLDAPPLPRLPNSLLLLAEDRAKSRSPEEWFQLATESPDGLRHNNATAMVGLLLKYLPPQYWQSVAWPAIQDWNTRAVKPPLSQKDLRTTFDSIARKEYEKYKV